MKKQLARRLHIALFHRALFAEHPEGAHPGWNEDQRAGNPG
jgi:hypothetical protein